MVYLIFIFCCFLLHICAGKGHSFIDDFHTPFHLRKDAQKFWRIHTDEYKLFENNNYVALRSHHVLQSPVKHPYGFVQLELASGFDDPMKLTELTAGRLSSAETYGFGSFRWKGVTRSKWKDSKYKQTVFDIWCCVSLEAPAAPTLLTLQMCTSTAHSEMSYIHVVSRAFEHKAFHYSGILADNKGVNYRIDYQPCHISFIINGKVLLTIGSEDMAIPATEVLINIGPRPSADKRGKHYDEMEQRVPFSYQADMRITRFRFMEGRNFPRIPFVHDEMLIAEDSSLHYGIIVSIVIAFVLLVILIFRCKIKADENNNSGYSLMDENDCTLNVS